VNLPIDSLETPPMVRGIAGGAHDMESVKDATGLYEVEHRARHAVRPGFRITELQISPTQEVPWHYHNNIQDTFYVLSGVIRIVLSKGGCRNLDTLN
jgi:quercetin dioxygenase-like cupin family protein